VETEVVTALAKAAVVLSIATVVGLPYLAWVEGRVEAAVSRRKGPHRVGWFGVLQPWADALKLLSKSIPSASIPSGSIPSGAGMNVAAVAAFVPPVLILAAIPFGSSPLADLHATLMYIAAVAGFAVHGHLLAAWAQRSDQSLLTALQAVARTVSCVAALGLTLLAAATSYSTLRLSEIVAHQSAVAEGVLSISSLEAWGVATQPLGFLIYLAVAISMVERGAESSRASAVHLLLLSGARGLQLIALAAVGVAIYLGAGHLPEGISVAPVAQLAQLAGAVFALKTALVLFLMSLMRAAIFRLGIDGFIGFGWKLLVPAAALNLLLTAALIAVAG